MLTHETPWLFMLVAAVTTTQDGPLQEWVRQLSPIYLVLHVGAQGGSLFMVQQMMRQR
jgi:hypothetical protein